MSLLDMNEPDEADERRRDDPSQPVDQRGNPVLPPSKLSAIQRFGVLQRWFRSDAEFSSRWRIQAREDFKFRSGEQWEEKDKAILEDQKRPIIVFNRVLTILKAVAGMEINGRHEIQFLPQNNEDTLPNELLSAASKWMASGCDAEDEESEGFDNCATCGMGWTENRLSYEDDPAGMYVEESIDPLEMYWDRAARKKNLTGARRVARVKRMPLGEAMQLFPGRTAEELDATWARGISVDGQVKSLEERRVRSEENSEENFDTYDDSNEVTIVHMQWIEREVYWLIADEQTNSKAELTEEQYERFRSRMTQIGIPVTAARMTRKVYQQAFLGNMLLQSGAAPCKNRFIWQCITGELDRDKGTWFGLIKVMRDPQMWANKWLSQTLHILNTTAKGGIVAETDAFDDINDAEEKWAQPDTIVWAAAGAIGGQRPKIMPKPGAGFTEGHVQLMTFAISAIRDCTGINLELLGLKDENQPGVLEAQRKQAGMTVLATLFDSLRRFRKNVGHVRLYYIQNYFSDGRLIRVAGPMAVKAIPLLRDKTFGRYDVIIDDAPTSPNQKEANWAVIAPMIALFKDQLSQNPQLFAAILEYSPLPTQLVELVKQLVNQSANDPKQQAIKQQLQDLSVQKLVAEINKDQSTAEMNNAKAGATQATASYDLAMAQNLLQKGEFDKLKFHLDAMAGAAAARKAEAESATQHAKTQGQVLDNHAKLTGLAQDQRATDQQHAIDQGQLANDTMEAHANVIGTLAKAHADHAKAHRDRIGAVVDAVQPVQTDEALNRPPTPGKAK